MIYGKTVEIFLVKGNVERLTTATLSNWDGFAIRIPRLEVSTCNLEELKQAGVYFLFCKDDNEDDAVYIGESENIKKRLIQHLQQYQSGKEKYYWTKVVVFTGKKLHKTGIRYLENKLVSIAKDCKRYNVLTKNTCSDIKISEALKESMNEFACNIKILMSTLGYKVLEPINTSDLNGAVSQSNKTIFFLNQRVNGFGAVQATGVRTAEGFVVLKDSRISSVDKNISPSLLNLKNKARNDGSIDKNNILQKDMLFSSPSCAASFVVGSSSNGQKSWKNSEGKTLKEIENSEIL